LPQRVKPRIAAAVGGDVVEDVDGGVGVDGVGDDVCEGLAGVLVDDVQDLQDPPVGGGVELLVQRPYMVRVVGLEPVSWSGGLPDPATLTTPRGHSEAFLSPQPPHHAWAAQDDS
jgi:hypothetical protein